MTAKSGRQLTWSTASIGCIALGEAGGGRQCEMSAGRKADHADSFRFDAPLAARLRTRLTARWASSCGPGPAHP